MAIGGPPGTRIRVRVVEYAWRLAVNFAVKYSPRWIGPDMVPSALLTEVMKHTADDEIIARLNAGRDRVRRRQARG